MDMDFELFASLAPVTWKADRLSPQDTKPRHLGRPVSFDFMDSEDPTNYSSEHVIGTLEAVMGQDFLISGEIYPYSRMQDLKVYRREIK